MVNPTIDKIIDDQPASEKVPLLKKDAQERQRSKVTSVVPASSVNVLDKKIEIALNKVEAMKFRAASLPSVPNFTVGETGEVSEAVGAQPNDADHEKTHEIVKLRGVELFKQQCHFSLTKHRLAAIHLGTMQFCIFTVPSAIIAMTSGVLAFLATSGLFTERTDSILNVIVGSLSFLVVFFQTISAKLKYDTRAEMHESTAIDLRDLRENLENIVNQSRVMIGYHGSDVEAGGSSETGSHPQDSASAADTAKNNSNNSEAAAPQDNTAIVDTDLEHLFDGIQKRYNQCLKGCKSTVPYKINDAFNHLDSRLNATMSLKGHEGLRSIYGSNYNNIIYFQACDDLGLRFTSCWFWPLRLPNPREVVNATMADLQTTIAESGTKYWDGLTKTDATTE